MWEFPEIDQTLFRNNVFRYSLFRFKSERLNQNQIVHDPRNVYFNQDSSQSLALEVINNSKSHIIYVIVSKC